MGRTTPVTRPVTAPMPMEPPSDKMVLAPHRHPAETTETTETTAHEEGHALVVVAKEVKPGKENDNTQTAVVDPTERASLVPGSGSRRRMAKFGSVRVAWHRMTLGRNPGVTTGGVPVEMGDYEGSERFESVDEYSQKMTAGGGGSVDLQASVVGDGRKKPMYRLSQEARRSIALQRHTEDELAEVEQEILGVKQELHTSRQEYMMEKAAEKAAAIQAQRAEARKAREQQMAAAYTQAQKEKEDKTQKKKSKKRIGLLSIFRKKTQN